MRQVSYTRKLQETGKMFSMGVLSLSLGLSGPTMALADEAASTSSPATKTQSSLDAAAPASPAAPAVEAAPAAPTVPAAPATPAAPAGEAAPGAPAAPAAPGTGSRMPSDMRGMFSAGQFAPTSIKPPDPTTPAAKQKDTVIRSLLDGLNSKPLTEAEKQQNKDRSQKRLDHMLDTIAAAANMSAEEKEALRAKLKGPQTPVPEKSAAAKAEFMEKMQCKQFVKDAGYRMFDDHFTTKELKDIDRFVRSSTGKKLLSEAPDMMLEGVELAIESYIPFFIDLANRYRRLHHLLGPRRVPADQQEMMERMKKMFQQQKMEPESPGQSKDSI